LASAPWLKNSDFGFRPSDFGFTRPPFGFVFRIAQPIAPNSLIRWLRLIGPPIHNSYFTDRGWFATIAEDLKQPKKKYRKRKAMPKDKPDQSKIVLYQTADGKVTVDVRFERKNFWLTQKALAELFGVKVPAINKHLKNTFESEELHEDSVISILETTAADGKSYQTRYYNLDAIICV
jgi:hypothetical protein